MSQEVPADDGAQVAPVVPAETTATAQEPTPATENDTPSDQPRDEQGRFESKDAFQKRVNELTWARRQAERERDEARQRVAALEAQTPSRAPAASSDKPPALEDYPDINQWAAAVAEHARTHAEQVATRAITERTQAQSQEQRFTQFQQREVAYAAEHPEYIDAAQRLGQTVRFQPEVLEVLAAGEHGPALVHHLANHLDKADEIARMSPVMAAYELARLEAQVTAPKTKPVTRAPAPVPTVGSGTPAPKDPDRMTADEWLAWRRNQLKNR